MSVRRARAQLCASRKMFYYSKMRKSSLFPLALASTTLFHACAATAAGQSSPPFVDFSLEQLAEVVVTSVSRQETRLATAPAAIFLISAADIRRSGANSLPEALRLAPNLQVARSDARTYAITARGFSSTLENKLLVLIDGRSVYSPLFSGVFWDMQDVMIEDIERIEVISGPGATIWGANAVNGVINIITRSARDTEGGLLAAGAGDHEKTGALRYGGQLGNGGNYRIYTKYNQIGDTGNEAGTRLRTGWERRQAGFRADWNGRANAVMLSGDVYQGNLGQVRGADIRTGGGNLLGRINSRLADGSDLRLQMYLDHTERDQPGTAGEILDTVDLEVQHGTRIGAIHNVVWGGGYRHAWDRVRNGEFFTFVPADKDLHWGNVFAQDEIALRPELRMTLGMKFEHNNYTGVETLPSLRLAWMPDSSRLLWGAASRTVRAPSRIDRELYVVDQRIPGAGGRRYTVEGGADFRSETAAVMELGYRSQPTADLSYSLTAFYSKYDQLRTLEPRPGQGAVFRNLGEGSTRGLEFWGRWQPARDWRLSGGLVLQDIDTDLKEGSQDTSGVTGLATNDPTRYWSLRSSHDLAHNLQFDLSWRYMGDLPRPAVPAYHELDLRLAWQPRPDLELSITGQNLLHAAHPEFGAAGGRQVFERTAFLKLSLRF
jgi:iron complex outermembrane receptor protein